jgi:hypothetical protein
MRTKPPQVPPAAQIAGAATIGQRVPTGSYTVRITRAGTTYTMPLTVGIDRRTAFTAADSAATYLAAENIKKLFARMTLLVGEIAELRDQADTAGAKLPAGDSLRTDLAQTSGRASDLRKLIVATTEGGAITGEQRLREDTADLYGAVVSSDGPPTRYALDRITVLDRELADVERKYGVLRSNDVPALDAKLKAKSLPPLQLSPVGLSPSQHDTDAADGGRLAALFAGLTGSHYRGSASALTSASGDDR